MISMHPKQACNSTPSSMCILLKSCNGESLLSSPDPADGCKKTSSWVQLSTAKWLTLQPSIKIPAFLMTCWKYIRISKWKSFFKDVHCISKNIKICYRGLILLMPSPRFSGQKNEYMTRANRCWPQTVHRGSMNKNSPLNGERETG